MNPTIGRIVHFNPNGDTDDPLPAIVVAVSGLTVDLVVFSENGSTFESGVGLQPDERCAHSWIWPSRT